MKPFILPLVGTALAVAGFITPILMAFQQQEERRNLGVVREGVLYRSAQLPVRGLARVVNENGIRTVVSLRDGEQGPDRAEEQWCAEHAIRFVRIPPLSWGGEQGSAPIDTGLRQFLKVMSDSNNWPVLVHCYRGVHRTGGYVAVYRMEFEDWSSQQAIGEMRDRGYVEIDWHLDINHYLSTYKRSGQYSLAGSATHRVAELGTRH